jgi:hypothetical protein
VYGTAFCSSLPLLSISLGGREPCGLKRAHGTTFCSTSPHLSVGYGGSCVSSIGCMGSLSAVPPLILHQFKRERALWAQEGAWDCFLQYLPSSLSRLRRELCELNRVHGIAFCGSSPYPPPVQKGESLVGSRGRMGLLFAIPPLISQSVTEGAV